MKVSVVCPYCGAGCKFKLVIKNGKAIDIDYEKDHPVAEGALCPKGNASLELIYHPERLLYPAIIEKGKERFVSWDEALKDITRKLLYIKERYGADSIGFIASSKVSNEENYLFQKLARLFGSPHVDHCARLCHAPSVVGLRKAFGSGAMTNPIHDLENAKYLLIIGSNLAENHPVVARRILEAKEKGAFIIAVDPRKTPTTNMAHLHLSLIPGTDATLLEAMMKVIIKEGLANYQFIKERTKNFEAFKTYLEKVDLQKASAETGVPLEHIITSARKYATSKASAIIYCMGITQHLAGTRNVLSCANLALLCGHIGKSGTGIYPLRGQNNVQGASDMGALVDLLPGYIDIFNTKERKRLASLWGREDLSLPCPGLSLVEMMNEALEGKIKAMIIMGENPIVSDPSSRDVAKALERLELLVVQEIFPTETSKFATHLLPSACFAEKSGSYTNTERRVQWSEKAVEPPKEAKPDLWIISELGKRLNLWNGYATSQEVLKEINLAIPAYRGITYERIKDNLEGLIWPCFDEDHPGTPILYEERFNTPDGFGHFTTTEKPFEETPRDAFRMITGRVTVHYNSGAMTRRINVLNRYFPDLWVSINPEDAKALGLEQNQPVFVKTKNGTIKAILKVEEGVKKGSLFIPFHFSDTNILTSKNLEKYSKIPALKDCFCIIEPQDRDLP